MTYQNPVVGRLPPPVIITPFSECSLGIVFKTATGGGIPGSRTWGSAKRIAYVPFYLSSPVTIAKVFWHNGATAAGSADCGIYKDAAGVPTSLIVNSTLTAQVGTNILQEVNITDTYLVEGAYWMALGFDSSTSTTFSANAATGAHCRSMGMRDETSTATPFVLPASATSTAPGDNPEFPIFGLSLRTLVA